MVITIFSTMLLMMGCMFVLLMIFHKSMNRNRLPRAQIFERDTWMKDEEINVKKYVKPVLKSSTATPMRSKTIQEAEDIKSGKDEPNPEALFPQIA